LIAVTITDSTKQNKEVEWGKGEVAERWSKAIERYWEKGRAFFEIELADVFPVLPLNPSIFLYLWSSNEVSLLSFS